MCGHISIRFIDFMLKGKGFLDYTNLFSLNDHEKNDRKDEKNILCYLW